jgi:TonB family protein
MKAGAEAIILTSEHLPVLGDAHPLRKKYRKFLITAAVFAGLAHLIGFGSWLVARSIHREPPPAHVVRIVKIADLGVPPSLSQRDVSTQVAVSAQVAPPSIGVPEPVPDFQAPNLTIASQEEMAQVLQPTDLQSLGGGGRDSLVVQFDNSGDESPNPEDFVAYEDAPVLITMPPPVYPEMARQAEVEGTVQVRLLVGKDGKVKDAIVTQGVTMLNDAAIEAAKKAIFKPALQQKRPVEVWVQVPMRFTLH